MAERAEGPDPPTYPPRYSHRQAVAWIISGLTDKPFLPELGPAPFDLRMRRLIEREIPHRDHREQLKAWCRAQMDEGAFREACRNPRVEPGYCATPRRSRPSAPISSNEPNGWGRRRLMVQWDMVKPNP